jgi:hypothetical protein
VLFLFVRGFDDPDGEPFGVAIFVLTVLPEVLAAVVADGLAAPAFVADRVFDVAGDRRRFGESAPGTMFIPFLATLPAAPATLPRAPLAASATFPAALPTVEPTFLSSLPGFISLPPNGHYSPRT